MPTYLWHQATPRRSLTFLSLHASPCSVISLSVMAEGAAQEWVACRPQPMNSPAAQVTSCLDQAVPHSHLYPHCFQFLCTSVHIVWVCVSHPRSILYNFVHCANCQYWSLSAQLFIFDQHVSLVSSFCECGADQNCGQPSFLAEQP